MSRKGNKLLSIPVNVNVDIQPNHVVVKGPLGELIVDYPPHYITIVKTPENMIMVSRLSEVKQAAMFHGTINANINNALIGVSEGYKKILKIVGVGFKAAISGPKLTLAIGFSHPVVFDIPDGLKVTCTTPTEIVITGYDKIVVGEFAANVRATRKPEPYNGKGIMYSDEKIIRKVGKTAEGSKK